MQRLGGSEVEAEFMTQDIAGGTKSCSADNLTAQRLHNAQVAFQVLDQNGFLQIFRAWEEFTRVHWQHLVSFMAH